MRGVSGFRRKPSIALPLVLTTIWIATVSDCQSNRTQNLSTSALQKLFFPDDNGICRVTLRLAVSAQTSHLSNFVFR